MKRLRFLAAAGAALAPRALCAQPALERIRLGAIPSDALTPLYYALQQGLFARAGIDLEIVGVANGTAATTAVIAGAFEMANTSLVPAMAAHLRGLPIAIVAPQGVYTAAARLTLLQVAADSPDKTGADLNGKIAATGALNDIGQLSTSCWVDKHGGDSKTLKWVEVPNVAMDEALVQHRVDAGVLSEPLLDASIAAGHTRTLGDPDGAIAPRFMYAAYVGRIDWAKDHADLVRRFVRVAGQAATFTNAHPAETAALMAEITKIPLAVMQRMKRAVCATELDPRLVQPLIDVAAKYQKIPQAFPARDLLFSA